LALSLEQNQSKRALDESLKGGFFLRKKPLEGIASGYSYSGFAIGRPFVAHLQPWEAKIKAEKKSRRRPSRSQNRNRRSDARALLQLRPSRLRSSAHERRATGAERLSLSREGLFVLLGFGRSIQSLGVNPFLKANLEDRFFSRE